MRRERNVRRRHGRRLAERVQRARSHERDVDGQHDDDLVARLAQSGDHTVHRRPRGGSVVEHREREAVGLLADDEHLVADLAQQALCTLRQRLAPEPRHAFGDPNRSDAPPTSTTPVSSVTRRSGRARCTRLPGRRGRSRTA